MLVSLMSDVARAPNPVDRRPGAPGFWAISVVVPAYNEENRLTPTILRIHDYLRDAGEPFEIIVVDDGSRDGTLAVARGLADRLPELRVLSYSENRGKGFAVRAGALQARGEAVLFTDADLSTPIEELAGLQGAIEGGAQVAIASRYLALSHIDVRQPLSRRYLGRVFNLVIGLLGVRGFSDTQCGFKLFRLVEARRIFSRLKTRGFAFDVEALLWARRLGYRIVEVPVRWANSSNSRVRPLRDASAMVLEVLKMKGLG